MHPTCVYTHTHTEVDSHYLRQFSKVAMNAEFVNTEPLLLGRYRARLLWASGHNVFVNWSFHILVLCTFLFKDASCKLYCWFMNIKVAANSTFIHAWEQLVWYLSDIFSAWHLTVFLPLESPDSTSAPRLGAISTVKSPTKRATTWKAWTKWIMKRTLTPHGQKQADTALLPGSGSAGNTHCTVEATHFLPLCGKHPKYWFGGYRYSLVSGQVYKYRIWIMNIELFYINRYRYTHIYICIYFPMSQPVGFVGENSGGPLL